MAWGIGARERTSTDEHKAWRLAVLQRDGYRCRILGRHCTRRANEADHIVPVAEGGAEFDLSNGQAACPACHSRKSAAEGHRAKARKRARLRLPADDHPGLRRRAAAGGGEGVGGNPKNQDQPVA